MNELLEGLGIDPGALLVNIVGFAILVYLLKRFAFGRIGQFMDERADAIEADIEHARADRQQAADALGKLNQDLDHVREQFRAETAESTRRAKQAVADMHAEARAQRQAIVEQGEQQVCRTREAMVADVKAQAADMAVAIAEKVLRDSLDEERQAGLVDGFIRDIGAKAAAEGPQA